MSLYDKTDHSTIKITNLIKRDQLSTIVVQAFHDKVTEKELIKTIKRAIREHTKWSRLPSASLLHFDAIEVAEDLLRSMKEGVK